jgi:hypothetical protein
MVNPVKKVFLASWPRSGNTMVRSILWYCFRMKSTSIYGEDEDVGSNRHSRALAGAVSLRDNAGIREAILTQPYLPVKTHELPVADGNYDPTQKHIYIVRDGREACLSWCRLRLPRQMMGRWTQEQVIRGECMFGSWSEHVKAWMDSEARSNMVILRYESVLTRLGHAIDLIASHLQINPVARKIPDWSEFRMALPWFFRTGRVDSWKEELTSEQIALFEGLHGDILQDFGYELHAKEVDHAIAHA